MGMNRRLKKNKKSNTKLGIAQCDECKNDFSVDTINLKKDTIIIDGSKYYLLHLVCPHCGKSYDVQLDDDNTTRILKTLQTVLGKMSKLKKSNMSREEKSEFNRLDLLKVNINKELETERSIIKKKLDGKSYKIESYENKEFILNLRKVN